MRIKILAGLLALSFLLGGCQTAPASKKAQYTATFLNLFDTVTTVKGYAETEEAFRQIAQKMHDELERYHQLFDIYNDYDGIANIKAINDQAGIRPVTVDKDIIALLLDCRDYARLTGGKVDVTFGSVLHLWHEARLDGIQDPFNAYLPNAEELLLASKHKGFDQVIIDEAASTVFIQDKDLRLDVGAIAKGWAAQRVAENAPEGMLLSVGGNVCATGPKPENVSWVIGIQNPDGNDNIHTIYVFSGSVVTSGDYQRTYQVAGKQYHHIIDPETQMPAKYWRSVTIVCDDSGLADALSTALFLLPLEQGQALVESCGADALWINADGQEFMTPGFRDILRT